MKLLTELTHGRITAVVLGLVLALALTACGGGGVEEGTDTTDADDAAEATEPADDTEPTDDAEPADDSEPTDEAEPTEDGGSADEAGSDEPIRIGMATSLSGAIALFGEGNRNGAQLAVDQLNEAGGVLGRQVELIVQDDQAQPEVGAQLARDMIIDQGVSAMLGPVSSGVALAITEITGEREIPFLVHTSNTEALTVEAFNDYVVSVVPNTGMEARAQGVDLADSEFTSWATISPNYEFGQRQTGTFVETIQAENPEVEILEQQWPELGEADFQPFITSLISSGAEAVYSPLFAGDLITFTQQADNLGLFDQVYFTALFETDALRELGDAVDLEGVRAYSRCPFAIDTPEMAEFVAAYQEATGDVPSDWACMAYDAVNVWAQVTEEVGSTDGPAFADAVGGFEFTSLRGPTTIRDIDHQAAVPSYIGELSLDEELGIYAYTNIQAVPAEETWLSEDEITALREG
ncbi:MAG TPA: ABC transporter substrate-binding protein [Euzebya sp.]|nr:ABC transporter substrate-binding protein [Euzebya sp.]